MALPKSNLDVAFSQGLDTKTDSKRVAPGKFLALSNSVFDTTSLKKRNGFPALTAIPTTDTTTLTTFGGSLTAIGSSLYNFAPETNTWYNKGAITAVSTDVVPLVRSATSQSAQDVAVTSDGLSCSVWADSDGNYKYQVNDTNSSQILVTATNLPSTATQARVFVLGRYFVITFLATVTAATHLRYIALPLLSPGTPGTATDLATQVNSLTAGYDAYSVNGNLYFSWYDVAPAVKVAYLTASLVIAAAVTIVGRHATYLSVQADATTPTPVIWVTFWDGVNSNLYAAAFSSTLGTLLAATILTNSASILQVTSAAANGVLTAFYQTQNTYSYSPNARTDYVSTVTCTQAAVVGTPTIRLRSVGLASKAFIIADVPYVAVAYGGAFQPTYFLMNSAGALSAKLAYENGGGYATTQVLPAATVADDQVQIGYLFKDLLTSVNKTQGVANVAGIYSQTGINLVTWAINTEALPPAEIGNNLHLSGGFTWMYDGSLPVEHNFHVFPEDVAISTSIGVTPTANTTSGSPIITAVSSMASVGVGATITGAGVPANTTILSISGSTATLSANATATATGVTMTIKGLLIAQQYYYQVVYEWTDAQGNIHRSAPSVPVGQVTTTTTSTNTLNIPTLRLTYKTGTSKVRIVIYRWSAAQENYYQITSISNPLLNDTSVDSVSYVDTHSDAQILGNQLIYTTGGVVENIAFPAAIASTLFKSRMVVIAAEDQNLLSYSKQVIQNVPVEPADLFTLFVAPTSGAQGSTGVNTALGAMDDKLIVFKRNAIYYITGNGPDNTGANNDFSEPQYITSVAGCTNPKSIVFMPQGLMFQSDKGIWLLGRDLSTNYVGAAVERYNDATVLSALNIPGTNQVRFTLDNGITLMYDYFYGQWGTFVGIPGVASTLYQNLHTYVNSLGAVFQESPGTYLDDTTPVTMSFTTGWLSLAGLQGFQRAYFFYLLGTYISPHKLGISIAYDFNPSIAQTALASPSNFNANYGDDAGPYGSGDPYGGQSSVEQFRIFLDKQKCQSFQLTVTESFDPSFGTIAGAGLTLSGINLVFSAKKAYNTIRSAQSVS